MKAFFIFLVFLVEGLAAQALVSFQEEHCQSQGSSELLLYSEDFKWGYTQKEMALKFEEIYYSGKRLKERAHYDISKKVFVLPRSTSSYGLKHIKLTENFILSVTRHIESALKEGFAEFVFFPDMGHSHLYFAQEHWDKHYKPTPEVKDFHLLYEEMLNDPQMLALYHTAEQLQMKDENKKLIDTPYHKFRYENRNPVGDNKQGGILMMPRVNPSKKKYNSVRDLPGYYRWSAGFNISASKKGCFSYRHKGRTFYYDISLKDIETKNGGTF